MQTKKVTLCYTCLYIIRRFNKLSSIEQLYYDILYCLIWITNQLVLFVAISLLMKCCVEHLIKIAKHSPRFQQPAVPDGNPIYQTPVKHTSQHNCPAKHFKEIMLFILRPQYHCFACYNNRRFIDWWKKSNIVIILIVIRFHNAGPVSFGFEDTLDNAHINLLPS